MAYPATQTVVDVIGMRTCRRQDVVALSFRIAIYYVAPASGALYDWKGAPSKPNT